MTTPTAAPKDTDILYKPIAGNGVDSTSKAAVFTLLNEAFLRPTAAQQIYSQKVEHRPLSVQPATTLEKDAREARRAARLSKLKRKRKPRHLSAKEKRELGIFNVSKHSVQYSDFEKLNRLWNRYVSEVVAHAGPDLATTVCGPILLKADYHGSFITIEDCRCKSRIGLSGICVKETKNMFEIVTSNNALLKIPKEKTLFRVKSDLGGDGQGKDLEWRIWGDQFMVRSGERAGKKFSGRNIRGKALLEL